MICSSSSRHSSWQRSQVDSALSDCLAAYWDGHALVYAFLCEHGSETVDEEFGMDDYVWEEWQPTLEA
ncbi:hypothetical protein BN2475_560002 [Paraburkholderia ribeironis]|uniref:Uncharacterized protein n=1 Tax=Paraburkholderia ribeironis TaxID=1247936 RepID=A0A1N7SDG6_9BURK|nr:hypothetical protein BN2475_560002 [Paraburkholderia ribeironis]